MPFKNRIRLPIRLKWAQFPEEREVFRKANGVSKTMSVVVRKTYQLETALMPERLHERLKIALAHDIVNIETDRYFGGVSQDADYTIAWPDFQDFPVGKGNTVVQVTPFNATNNNCATCAEMNQVVAEDDTFPDTLEEGETYSLNLFANDGICCAPVTATIVTQNSAYIDSASIDPDTGELTITMKATLQTGTGINLLTYRVTCPNGGYDEADVFGSVEGTVPGCSSPENVRYLSGDPTETEVNFTWNTNGSPADGYQWELYEASNLGTPVLTGDTPLGFPQAPISGLTPGTDYIFIVKAICDTGVSESPYTSPFPFTTATSVDTCGRYTIEFNDGTPFRDNYVDLSYTACNSSNINIRLYNMQSRFVCLLQNAPNDPVFFTGGSGVTLTYDGICV